MKDANEYLLHVRALVIANEQVLHWTLIREEAQSDKGLFRYRLALRDGGTLELFEYFRVVEGQAQVRKYSFQWQDSAGKLRRRWDNAAHHPEVPTHPHHVHDGVDENVLPHAPIDAEGVLGVVADKAQA